MVVAVEDYYTEYQKAAYQKQVEECLQYKDPGEYKTWECVNCAQTNLDFPYITGERRCSICNMSIRRIFPTYEGLFALMKKYKTEIDMNIEKKEKSKKKYEEKNDSNSDSSESIEIPNVTERFWEIADDETHEKLLMMRLKSV